MSKYQELRVTRDSESPKVQTLKIIDGSGKVIHATTIKFNDASLYELMIAKLYESYKLNHELMKSLDTVKDKEELGRLAKLFKAIGEEIVTFFFKKHDKRKA